MVAAAESWNQVFEGTSELLGTDGVNSAGIGS